MPKDLCKNAVVGTKQVLRAIQEGKLERIYLAEDADAFLQNKLRSVCYEYGVELETVPSMRGLGEECGIDVGAACAGVPKQMG
ncbi:MAG TPA: ribosomal L7Ae/L30e/S12e/Gadd45 family protein [Clostridia bacterium]|nr:MAG: Ribosome-associated protein L7Ae-like protein [Firmicutes bacterium ADurb.Bin356]HOF94670.1 ribosomal L7Ae/L30e/S12e/Gadd45 family protein [Clostridia bacterium]HOR13325.1 ribosomal L7Ae/L30e/S12e/Gadd45 family protein [Clostridia bacterium]